MISDDIKHIPMWSKECLDKSKVFINKRLDQYYGYGVKSNNKFLIYFRDAHCADVGYASIMNADGTPSCIGTAFAKMNEEEKEIFIEEYPHLSSRIYVLREDG